MDTVLLLARVVTAFVLVFAAAAKLVQGASSFRETVVDLGIPTRFAGPVTVALIPVELTIAVLLLPGQTAWWASVAAAGLLGAFTTLIAVNLAQGRRPACNCFGQISSEPIGTQTLVRNAVLFSIALVPAVWSPPDSGPGVLAAARSAVTDTTDAARWLTVLAGVVALEAIALLVLHGRKPVAAPGDDVDAAPADAGLPVGAPAPDFALADRDGATRRLADLLEPGVPLMLLFSAPTCAPCTALLPELATWHRAFDGALRIVLLSHGAKDDLPSDVEVLVDEGGLVAQSYRYVGTPGAVIVAPDGIVSSPLASGPAAIRQLVARTVADLALDGSVPLGELVIGDDAPGFTLDTLHGHPVSLSDYAGSLVLLVFWDSACGYCHRLLPDLRRWEAERPAGVHLVVVSIGTEEGLRAQGWQSHVALDPGSLVTKSYGGFGTPTAVLVDASGRVASDLAVGADEVLTLAARAERLARLAGSFTSS